MINPFHAQLLQAKPLDWIRESPTSLRLKSGLGVAFSKLQHRHRTVLRVRLRPLSYKPWETIAVMDAKALPKNDDPQFLFSALKHFQSSIPLSTVMLLHQRLQQVLLEHGGEGQWNVLTYGGRVYVDRKNDEVLQKTSMPSDLFPTNLIDAVRALERTWIPSFTQELAFQQGKFDIVLPASAHARLEALQAMQALAGCGSQKDEA